MLDCVIFSSTAKVPDIPVSLIAFVALKVAALAAEAPDFGSLIKHTFLKSFATETSPEFADSVPS